MDKSVIEMLVHRAGLQKALAEFPEDVTAAAMQATGAAGRLPRIDDPRAEPWPPMQPGERL